MDARRLVAIQVSAQETRTSPNISTNRLKQKKTDKLKNLRNWYEIDSKKKKLSQIQRYKKAGADPIIQSVIEQGNAKGLCMERYARDTFGLKKRTQKKRGGGSGYDHRCIINRQEFKIEHKTSGSWNTTFTEYRWQHIECAHDWEHLLLTAIYLKEIRWYMICKKKIKMLTKQGVVTIQGKKGKSNEGLWMNYSTIKEYLVEIDESDPDSIKKYIVSFIINKNIKKYLSNK